jgi:hypothetical protein
MRSRLVLLLGLVMFYLGGQAAIGQTVAGLPPKADPQRLRAIVQAGAREARTRAVVFGMWVRDREALTLALGKSRARVPAGLYEDCTYWNPSWGSTPGLPTSNLHDLGKWAPILGAGRLISPAHFREQIAPTSVGKGMNRPDLYFAFGFVIANGWIVQNPSINGYSGAFAYNLASGVTIVVAATKSRATDTDGSAFDILRDVVKYVTPESPIDF